jgi:hypothetical protein
MDTLAVHHQELKRRLTIVPETSISGPHGVMKHIVKSSSAPPAIGG